MTKITIANNELDYKTIASLAEFIWQEHYIPIIGIQQVDFMLHKFQSTKAIKEQISEGASYYLIKHQGNTIGYLSFYKKKDSLFLSKLYVLSSSRGKGIGKTAMNFIQSKAEQFGYYKMSLTVNKFNTASIKAYEKMNFKKIKDVVIDIGNGFIMDDYLMEKKLD